MAGDCKRGGETSGGTYHRFLWSVNPAVDPRRKAIVCPTWWMGFRRENRWERGESLAAPVRDRRSRAGLPALVALVLQSGARRGRVNDCAAIQGGAAPAEFPVEFRQLGGRWDGKRGGVEG